MGRPVRFEMLGPLRVRDDSGEPVQLGGPLARRLLAALLIDGNRIVATDRLVDDLWEGEPPPQARASVHVQVSRLRSALGRDRIVTEPPGYRLVVGDGELDAAEFEALVREAQAAARERDASNAAAQLRAALDLWRGAALADVADFEFARAEAARLDEARLVALEARIAADLDRGEHDQLVGELEALTAAYPFREGLWAQLMRSLYRAGRQAEALRVYQRLRDTLADELGLEPSPEVQDLERAILEQSSELGPAPATRLDSAGRGAATASNRAEASAGPAAPLIVPLPRALQAQGLAPFVGREKALAQIETARQESAEGSGRAVLVAGEAGIGKTRLVAEVATAAHDAGALVLHGRCDEDQLVPYQPVVEAFRHLIVHCPPDSLGPYVGGLPDEIAPLMPSLTRGAAPLRPDGGASSDPTTERYRLFEAVAEVVDRLARHQPVVLVLDDLHWADRPTLLLVRHALRALPDRPVLVVGTYRDDELTREHALAQVVSDLRRESLAQRVLLAGLDLHEVERMAGAITGRTVAPALVEALHEETTGNPFFIEELARHLTETGGLDEVDDAIAGAGIDALGIPEGIRDVIERRLLRRTPDCVRALTVASVVGHEFDLEVLERVTELDDERMVEVMEEAAAARIVAEVPGASGRYAFAHALIRETLYSSFSTPRRVRVHRLVADALESTTAASGNPAELALHYCEAAQAGDLHKALHYSELAARQASDVLAYEEAGAHYERALATLDLDPEPDEAKRGELMLALGQVCWSAGEPEGAVDWYERAMALGRERGDATLFASAVLGYSHSAGTTSEGYSAHGYDAALVALIEEALEQMPDEDSPLRASLLGRLAVLLYWSSAYERRAELIEEAVAIARRNGGETVVLAALINRHLALWRPGGTHDRLANTVEMLRLAERTGQAARVAEARLYRLLDLLELGDVSAADREIAWYVAQGKRLRQPYVRWHAAFLPALRALMEGRFAEAEEYAGQAIEHGQRAGNDGAVALWGLQMMWLWREQGRLTELVGAVEGVSTVSGDIAALDTAKAWVAAEAGDLRLARERFALLAADGFAGIPQDVAWLGACALLSSTCAVLQDGDAAATLYDLLQPHSGLNILLWAGFCPGPVDHYLGLLARTMGEPTRAIAHFEDALALAAAMRARPLLERIRLDYAKVLHESDDDEHHRRADELLTQAGAGASDLGMSRLAELVADAQALT